MEDRGGVDAAATTGTVETVATTGRRYTGTSSVSAENAATFPKWEGFWKIIDGESRL